MKRWAMVALLAVLVVPSALAQSGPNRNPILTDNGGMRTSKIIGSAVYNERNQKVGSIDDVVIGSDRSLNVVISIGGFLGLGAKTVRVPFDRLQFGATSDNHVVLPGATVDALNAMPEYHYTNQG